MDYKYFIGHKKPDFPLWDNFSFFEIPSEQETSNSFDQIFRDQNVFNEYSSLFFLRRKIISSGDRDGSITLCQYRRFVLNKKIGQHSLNMPWAMVLSTREIQQLKIQDEVLPLPGNLYLIGSAIRLPNGILGQYAQVHFTRDILSFTSALIDSNILSDQEALAFLSQPFLIPSPSCGTFTLECFLTIFDTLEKATNSFWHNGYKAYQHKYQGRVFAFLLERLNSYLLLKFLAEQKEDINRLFGSTTIISDDLNVRVGVMSEA